MGYVALKTIEMNDHTRAAGAPIPEAANWPHLNSWVKRGFVTFVPDGMEEEFTRQLRAGHVPQHLAPVAKPYHLNSAARLLSYGTAPAEAKPEPSPPVADAVPPTEDSLADTLFPEPDPEDASPAEKPAKRKRG